jgi:hypothetical protein
MTVQPEPGGYTSGNALYCLRMLPFLTGAVAIVIVRAKSASEDARQYKQQARWDAQHQFQPDPTQPPFTRDARIRHPREGDVPAGCWMSVNWRIDHPATEMDERMALGQARGPLREPGPDDPVGIEDEKGEP